MLWRREPAPDWWRGKRPERFPIKIPQQLVLRGEVNELDLNAVPLDGRTQLKRLCFEQATCRGLHVTLDELSLSTRWSSFEDCRFQQRSRRLHREGFEPQGSFGHRPCLYRNCTFVGVRLRLRAGFSVGYARFEDCIFERCRFEEHFSFDAEYVRCRFVGPVKMAVFNGTSLSGRRNEIVDNDFTEALLSDNIGLRNDFPSRDQRWPAGYNPPADDIKKPTESHGTFRGTVR